MKVLSSLPNTISNMIHLSVMDTSQGFGDLKNEMEKSGNREDRVKKEEAEASLTIM